MAFVLGLTRLAIARGWWGRHRPGPGKLGGTWKTGRHLRRWVPCQVGLRPAEGLWEVGQEAQTERMPGQWGSQCGFHLVPTVSSSTCQAHTQAAPA